MARERVLSGMRSSGKLHLGNLLGALQNWVNMQETYDCFYFIADWHSLTTGYTDTSQVRASVRDIAIDYLSAGLDPNKSVLFIQSLVPEHAELHLLLSMITPLAWLERVPTFKEQQQEMKDRDLATYGFLGYPLLQTADIIMYKANWVPVGIDQVAHIELSREIVRRFNNIYNVEVFPEPQPKLTEVPKLPGLDGRKMSKSYDNTIYLSDSQDTLTQKVKTMMTDPARQRRRDPGDPEVCPVFDFHRIYSSEEERQEVAVGCRTAGIGCIDCKGVLSKNMLTDLQPLHEKRAYYVAHPQEAMDVLVDGSAQARSIAKDTMAEVREAMHI
ncbi:MAG: tryptophan--tRNA ligase [Candidatus Tectomicrobia bacterium]|uniref:Tryptophan--tRNA ligase n=1 Tax=Tectimicrobiota bacterium TaxID=2528274 RepID=A0A937W3N0_UNCTE|nr:tryptophan--tRNA ligase [Candidatus Tectomicrobia bacterium]